MSGGAALLFAALLSTPLPAAAQDVDERIVIYERGPKRLEADRKRKSDIERCASCHPKIYEIWKSGPHGVSFENVSRAIRKTIGPVENLSKRKKKKRMKEFYRSECVACHSPMKLVWEDGLQADWDGVSKLKPDFFEDREWLTQTNGIDCITCHTKGARVVTRHDYKPQEGFVPPEGFCDPIASKAFTHIYSCYPCHGRVAEVYAKEFQLEPAKRKFPLLHCNQCHMETGPDGRRTHYTYHSSEPKKIKAMIVPELDKVSMKISEEAGKPKSLSVRWDTGGIPHKFIPGTPKVYLFRFELLDGENQAVFTRDVRFFHEERPRTRKRVRKTNASGEMIILENGEVFSRDFPLPASITDPHWLRLTVFKKGNYSDSDEEAVRVYRRDVPLR